MIKQFGIIGFLTFFVLSTSHAASIDCYSGNKKIYHAEGVNVHYADDFVEFTDAKSKKKVFAFSACIVKMDA